MVPMEDMIGGVMQTLSEMLLDRGYADVHQEDSTRVSAADGDHAVQAVCTLADGADARVGIKSVRALKRQFPTMGRLIIVSENGATPFLNTQLPQCEGVHVEVFSAKQMMRNVSRHSAVPPHEALSEEAAAALLRAIGVTGKDALPILLRSDPIVRYYDWPSGTVIRIHRADCTGEGLMTPSVGVRVVS